MLVSGIIGTRKYKYHMPHNKYRGGTSDDSADSSSTRHALYPRTDGRTDEVASKKAEEENESKKKKKTHRRKRKR